MGEATGNRLNGQLFTDQGGLAGILSGSADGLLTGLDKHQRERALELLFRLVQVDLEAQHHAPPATEAPPKSTRLGRMPTMRDGEQAVPAGGLSTARTSDPLKMTPGPFEVQHAPS